MDTRDHMDGLRVGRTQGPDAPGSMDRALSLPGGATPPPRLTPRGPIPPTKRGPFPEIFRSLDEGPGGISPRLPPVSGSPRFGYFREIVSGVSLGPVRVLTVSWARDCGECCPGVGPVTSVQRGNAVNNSGPAIGTASSSWRRVGYHLISHPAPGS